MQKMTADISALCQVPQADIELFVKWVWALREKNSFDMQVMTYPRACMARVQSEEETVMLVPFHPVLMYESLAPKPGLTDHQRILGLWKINQVVDEAMRDTGMYESFFITSDAQQAETCSRHGWTVAMHDPERKCWLLKHRVAKTEDKALCV